MARLLVIEPEEYFHTLFQEVLAQASYVAPEAVNSYEGSPAADVAVTRDIREPSTAHLLIHEPEAQFLAFRVVLAQEGYVVTAAVHSYAGRPATDSVWRADVMMDIQYLVVY